MSTSTPSEVAERLRLRYPRSPLPRPVVVVVVAVLAVVFLGWLLWTAALHSRPPVSGQVASYEVLSDTEIAVTVTVDRPDPSQRVICSVFAQSADFQTVGAIDRLEVPARAEKLVNVNVTLKTLRRATSASVKSCSLP